MIMSIHEDPQAAQEFRWADYEQDLELATDQAIEDARKSFGRLRSILLQSPEIVGHYRSALADLANDFLEIAAQAPNVQS